MKKYFSVALLCALAGCAYIPIFGRSPTPATPVFFQPRSAALDQPALQAIETAARYAAAQPDAPVTITGSADTIGNVSDNRALAAERAQAVAARLEADGVAEGRIQIRSVGPIASPEGENGQTPYARRVLIRIGG